LCRAITGSIAGPGEEKVPGAGGLGKPLSWEDWERIMREAGLTAADMRHARQVNAVADAFGFETMLEAILDANKRAERSVLRRLHRRIKQSASR
jgi:hypothetical protein